MSPVPALALSIALATATATGAPAEAATPTATAAPAEVRVAVVEFTSATADAELRPLGKGLQSMVATDLAGVPGLRVVERERLKEILAELKLARSAQIDRGSAAHLGKLSGATHLLTGAFTVAAGHMRIDARLLSAQTGEVVVAEQIEGERDAFFELEKALAAKVVSALGIRLTPRDRAALAKVHTADFEAFRLYSQGIAAFDDRRYDDALAALGGATAKDKDFQLAARTLEGYERLVADIRQRATTLEAAAESEVDRRARLEQARKSAKWGTTIEALWKLAAASGGGEAQQDRLAATFLLAAGYRGRFELQQPRGDRFALARTADELEARYAAEAGPLFPRLPPVVLERLWEDPASGQPPIAWVRVMYAALANAMKPSSYPASYAVADALGALFTSEQSPALALRLDGRQTVRLAERLVAWVETLNQGRSVRDDPRETLARYQRDTLDLDGSTAYWTERSRQAKDDARGLRMAAAEIDRNRSLLELVTRAAHPDLARELLLLDGAGIALREVPTLVRAEPGQTALCRALHNARQLPRHEYVMVDGVPVWLVHATADRTIGTGPRSDLRRAAELRYWPPADEEPADASALVIVEGRPRADLRADFTADFALPDDARFARYGRPSESASSPPPPPEPAEVGYAFGVQNPEAGEGAPATGLAVLLGPDSARLIRVVVERRSYNKTSLSSAPIDEKPWQRPAGRTLQVTVRVKGTAVEVDAGGRKVVFRAPEARSGFHGLLLRRSGYATIGHLRVAAP